jgi:hypothetical protein
MVARIDRNSVDHKFENELKDIKKIISKKNRPKLKRFIFKGCGCCGAIFIAFCIIFMLLTYIFVKSGLFAVPFVSNYFYEFPKPYRQIEISDYKKLRENIKAKNEQFWNNLKKYPQEKAFMYISEMEATYLFEKYWKNNVSVKDVSVVIQPSFVEIYLILSQFPNSPLIFHIFPYIEQRELKYKILGLKIGQLQLPQSLSRLFLDYIIHNLSLSKWNLMQYIRKIELSVKELKLFVQFK